MGYVLPIRWPGNGDTARYAYSQGGIRVSKQVVEWDRFSLADCTDARPTHDK